jgi:thiamine pyrophosphokinase
MRAIIFANGVMDKWPAAIELSVENDLLIAADGGLSHCLNRQIKPHILVGDMDSVHSKDLSKLAQQGIEVIRFPKHKDQTDLQLAIQLALQRNIQEIYILGALGERWDMTLSNVLILASPMLKAAKVTILENGQEIFCLHGGQDVTINGRSGDVVSLMPLAQDAVGVTLAGFEYPLNAETLSMGTTRGVSNVLKGGSARISLRQGHLLVVISRST